MVITFSAIWIYNTSMAETRSSYSGAFLISVFLSELLGNGREIRRFKMRQKAALNTAWPFYKKAFSCIRGAIQTGATIYSWRRLVVASDFSGRKKKWLEKIMRKLLAQCCVFMFWLTEGLHLWRGAQGFGDQEEFCWLCQTLVNQCISVENSCRIPRPASNVRLKQSSHDHWRCLDHWRYDHVVLHHAYVQGLT